MTTTTFDLVQIGIDETLRFVRLDRFCTVEVKAQ